MSRRLFTVCKYLVIVFFPPTLILSVIDLTNSIWWRYDLEVQISIWAKFCFRVLAASFLVAIVLLIVDRDGGDREEEVGDDHL